MRNIVLPILLFLCVLILSGNALRLYVKIFSLECEMSKANGVEISMWSDADKFGALILSQSINKRTIDSVVSLRQSSSMKSFEMSDSTLQLSNFRLCFREDTLVRIIPTFMDSKYSTSSKVTKN